MHDLNHSTLVFLDYFFLTFHSIFTIFNIIGWIWKKTRKIHLIVAFLTVFSWVFLGIWYGWGYCFLTDWHWDVREALGNPPDSHSYVHFLIRETTGLDLPKNFVDKGIFIVFAISTSLSIWLNIRDFRRKRKSAG